MKLGSVSVFERKFVGGAEDPLIIRFILFRCPSFGVYLHKLCRSDYDRALHDHPWPFVSVILRTGYIEVHNQTRDGAEVQELRKPGSVMLRPAEWRHRVLIADKPAWSLILVGRRQQRWGFFPAGQWCWWRKFNPAKNICDDDILWTEGGD